MLCSAAVSVAHPQGPLFSMKSKRLTTTRGDADASLARDDIEIVADGPDPERSADDNSAGSPVDGRRARSERSREAMADALLDLLKSGDLQPSSALIAERAGVTQRTLFNQFGDMDSLVSAVAQRQIQRIFHLVPVAGTGTLGERVTSYTDGLEHLLEETMHVRWAVVTNPNPEWNGARVVQNAREFMRAHLRDSFTPEFATLDDDGAMLLLDALELETDPVTWRLRRLQQELSADEARECVRHTMLALLTAATTR